ncbi:MAG: hypothetical protein WC679_02510 [Bacteroidales bacterium]|jgi:hypothetical protein
MKSAVIYPLLGIGIEMYHYFIIDEDVSHLQGYDTKKHFYNGWWAGKDDILEDEIDRIFYDDRALYYRHPQVTLSDIEEAIRNGAKLVIL